MFWYISLSLQGERGLVQLYGLSNKVSFWMFSLLSMWYCFFVHLPVYLVISFSGFCFVSEMRKLRVERWKSSLPFISNLCCGYVQYTQYYSSVMVWPIHIIWWFLHTQLSIFNSHFLTYSFTYDILQVAAGGNTRDNKTLLQHPIMVQDWLFTTKQLRTLDTPRCWQFAYFCCRRLQIKKGKKSLLVSR